MQHKKQSTMAGNLDSVSICTSTTKSVRWDFSWIENYKLIYYMAWKSSPKRVWLFHKNPSCYNKFFVLNFIMLSAQCVVVLYWYYFLVLFCCYVVPLLISCSTIQWYSDCSASIRLYVPPVLRYSAGVPCFVIPCSGVLSFIACPYSLRSTIIFLGIATLENFNYLFNSYQLGSPYFRKSKFVVTLCNRKTLFQSESRAGL